jgi:hypothetical protein
VFASSSGWASASTSASARAGRSAERGKSDLIDAALAARRLLGGKRLSIPRGAARREELRLLLLERRSALQARTAALNQLALLVTAADHVRERLGARSGERLAQPAARLRPRPDVVNGVLRRLGTRVERLSKELAEAERALAALLAEVAPRCSRRRIRMVVSSGAPRSTSSSPRTTPAGLPIDTSSVTSSAPSAASTVMRTDPSAGVPLT